MIFLIHTNIFFSESDKEPESKQNITEKEESQNDSGIQSQTKEEGAMVTEASEPIEVIDISKSNGETDSTQDGIFSSKKNVKINEEKPTKLLITALDGKLWFLNCH